MRYFFVEDLRLANFVLRIWPRLRAAGARSEASSIGLYYVDGTSAAIALANWVMRRLGGTFGPLEFHMIDVRDTAGKLLRLRVAYEDLADVQARIVDSPAFQSFLRHSGADRRLAAYLAKKSVVGKTFFDHQSLWRSVYLIQVCVWWLRRTASADMTAVLFLSRCPWMEAVISYAEKYGIEVVPVGSRISLKNSLMWLGGRESLLIIGALLCLLRGDFSGLRRPGKHLPRVALQYYGQFGLEQRECYTDFFFWQQSRLPGQNLLATFSLPQDKLDLSRLRAMAKHGIEAVALDYRATSLPAKHVYGPINVIPPLKRLGRLVASMVQSKNKAWLIAQTAEYRDRREYWKNLFAAYNVKVHTMWYRYDAEHSVIAEAMRSVGGVATLYQRAYESYQSPETAINTDVFFAFSPAGAQIESLSLSRIPYYVATGYLGDHGFPYLRGRANALRAKLQANGARFIVSYFDENSRPDSRWHTGHEFMRTVSAGATVARPQSGVDPQTQGSRHATKSSRAS